jgi:alpha-galactosidase
MTIFASDFYLKTDNVIIHINDQLHMNLEFPGDKVTSIIEANNAVQIGIQIDGKMITSYKFRPENSFQKPIEDVQFGKSLKAVVAGIYQDNAVKIERQSQILIPEKYPDVIILSTTYQNMGDNTIHIDKVYSQRLLLNRQLAEPEEKSYNFASFQGGAQEWGNDYALIWLKPDFYQSNFTGIHEAGSGEHKYKLGGGMPFIDVWSKTMGVALTHLQKNPAWLSLPVKVREDGRVEIAITEEPKEEIGQHELLKPGERYETVMTAIIFHKLDYHDPLRIYGNLLRDRGIDVKSNSYPSSHEPYWMTHGFGHYFDIKDILNSMPTLKSIGISRLNLDNGWFDYTGDWNVDRSPGKFPGGESDIKQFVGKIKKQGFRTALWWHPSAVHPESKLAKERPGLLIQAKDGTFPQEEENNYQLCPAYEPALKNIETQIERFVNQWGFDGFYIDKMGNSAVPPCYNKAHNHQSPLESFESVPKLFKRIEQTLLKYVNDPFLDVCICSLPHSPYNMPFYTIASASDPINLFQMRRRIKVEKAIHGPVFSVGDAYQVPTDEWNGYSVPQSFESAMGTGAHITTLFADLSPEQLEIWKTWFRKYDEMGLSSGEYLNYYDIAFDLPETHVVKKGETIYYGMFSEHWPKAQKIELRGLDKNKSYEIIDYAHDRNIGIIKGSSPYLNVGFKESLLIRVKSVETN